MTKYAAQTSVSVEKSRAEIETVLRKYGATEFAYMTTMSKALIVFRAHERLVRFTLPLPDQREEKFSFDRRTKRDRRPEQAHRLWEQECRSRWRSLVLVIKAKLEAVQSGIMSFETEFLGNIVLPDNKTVAEHSLPQIRESYRTGAPTLLLGSGKQ